MRRSDWWVWMWVFGVIGIKLPAPQKLSCGPFWSDGFWLGSPAPGLQMWFEDCFYLPLWNTRTDKKQTILFGGDTKSPSWTHHTNSGAQHKAQNLFIFTFSGAFRQVGVHAHTLSHTLTENIKILFACSEAIPFKREKDVENDWSWKPLNSPVSHHTSILPSYLPHTAC